jgi:hypothetical protein
VPTGALQPPMAIVVQPLGQPPTRALEGRAVRMRRVGAREGPAGRQPQVTPKPAEPERRRMSGLGQVALVPGRGPMQRPLTCVKVAGHEVHLEVRGRTAVLHAQVTPKLAVPGRRVIMFRGHLLDTPTAPMQRPLTRVKPVGHARHLRGRARTVGRVLRGRARVGGRDPGRRRRGGVAQMTPCVAVPSTLVSQPAGHVKLPRGARQRYPPGSERGLRPRRRTQRPGQPVLVMRRLSAHVAPCSGVAGCVAFQPVGQLTTPAGATQTRDCPSWPMVTLKLGGQALLLGASVRWTARDGGRDLRLRGAVGGRGRALPGEAQMTPCVGVPMVLMGQPAGHTLFPVGARQRKLLVRPSAP